MKAGIPILPHRGHFRARWKLIRCCQTDVQATPCLLAEKRIFRIGSARQTRVAAASGDPDGPVAQPDRVADFYSAGCRFESCRDRHLFRIWHRFFEPVSGRVRQSLTAGPTAVCPPQFHAVSPIEAGRAAWIAGFMEAIYSQADVTAISPSRFRVFLTAARPMSAARSPS
jgi:hypothetical protein